MPLTELQFELLSDESLRHNVVTVHDYLSINRKLAFSADEVSKATHIDARSVLAILEKLDDLDVVESGFIDGSVYFLYRRDLPDLR
jgi:hypothetical protein